MNKRKKMRGIVCFAVALWVVTSAAAEVKSSKHGVTVIGDDISFAVTVASPEAFRMTVAFEGGNLEGEHVYIDPDAIKNVPPWEKVEEGGDVGIKTVNGAFLVDPVKKKWTLKNASGKEVSSGYIIYKIEQPTNFWALMQRLTREMDVAAFRESPYFAVGVGLSRGCQVYGSGDRGSSSSLQGGMNNAHVANGVFNQTYIWATDGYGCLVIPDKKLNQSILKHSPPLWCGNQNKNKYKDVESFWLCEGTSASFYFYNAPGIQDGLRCFRNLTGAAPVPPKWSFGYLACRWGWKDPAYITDILNKFRDGKYPVDAFIYDFECYTPKPDYGVPPEGDPNIGDFDYNPALFPEGAKQIQACLDQGVRTICMRKPRIIKSDDIKYLKEKKWVAANAKGWERRNIEFSNPDVRKWYAEKSEMFLKDKVAGWWNDEGERNIDTYLYWNMAELDAWKKIRPNERFWSLNRAAAPGQQRTGAAVWTGDRNPKWKDLGENIRKKLRWSLAGQLYHTDDIGGFNSHVRGGARTEPELAIRWYQAGAFFPVMRTHSSREEIPRWPFFYEEEHSSIMRETVNLRYRLIPYSYSHAHDAYKTGISIMSAMVVYYPDYKKYHSVIDQWMFGPSILAAPILTDDSKRSVVLPEGNWFEFGKAKVQAGGKEINVTAALNEIPLYVKEGSIIPLGLVVQHTGQMPGGSLELQVYAGKDAGFVLVEDDGKSNDYLKGKVRRTVFSWDDKHGTLSWKTEGIYKGADLYKEMVVRVFAADGKIEKKTARLSGKKAADVLKF